MKQQPVLFTPGPVMTSDRLKCGLSHPDIPHRRSQFEEIYSRNRQNLLKLYGANQEYTAVVVTGSGTAANEAALRLLCIRAELLSGAPTPPEELELRREYQMRRLVESMGHGERVTPAALDDLALEWIAAATAAITPAP